VQVRGLPRRMSGTVGTANNPERLTGFVAADTTTLAWFQVYIGNRVLCALLYGVGRGSSVSAVTNCRATRYRPTLANIPDSLHFAGEGIDRG
jgi:hypothetical protein